MSDYQGKLSHLSAEQIETLYQRYSAGDRIATLLEHYAIDLRPSSLIKAFPPMQCADLSCPWCQGPLYTRRKGKSEPARNVAEAFCQSCSHRYYFPAYNRLQRYCICPPCAQRRAEERENQDVELRNTIAAFWALDAQPMVPFADLSFISQLNLMALIEARGDACIDRIRPADMSTGDLRLSPSQSMDAALFDEMRQCHLLLPDPDSDLEAFALNPAMPRLEKVRWVGNITFDGHRRASLTEVYRCIHQAFSRGPQAQWHAELSTAIRHLAVEEVYGYIEDRCSEHGLPFRARERGRDVIGELLKKLPVCSIWYLSNTALRSALQFAARCNVNKLHAANSIPGKLWALGQRAIDEQWPMRWSRHSSNTPRSVYSKILHGMLLGQHDGGLERRVAEYLQELPAQIDATRSAPDSAVRHCTSCGSDAVHAQLERQRIIINCKDCLSRSVVLASGLAG